MTKAVIPRREVAWFACQMEQQLVLNDHKGGWTDCGTEWLLTRLLEEARELSVALTSCSPLERVVKEAADVANFAMMIADVTRMEQKP